MSLDYEVLAGIRDELTRLNRSPHYFAVDTDVQKAVTHVLLADGWHEVKKEVRHGSKEETSSFRAEVPYDMEVEPDDYAWVHFHFTEASGPHADSHIGGPLSSVLAVRYEDF